MQRTQKAVLAGGIILLALLLIINLKGFLSDSNGAIRIILGIAFFLLVLLRPKHHDRPDLSGPGEARTTGRGVFLIATAIVGTLIIIVGIIAGMRHLNWLGGLLLVYSCLRWASADRSSRDIALSLFVIYWVHPPAGQFELAMQWLSINGAEWLLHCVNVRVWADSFVLRTGPMAFAVPQACSGMRTATTVMLTCLGSAILLRLRWHDILALLVLALTQVLAMNILRISIMVHLAPRMPEGWADTFLHDSLTVFLLAALVLTQLEGSLLRAWRLKRRQHQQAMNEGSSLPDTKGSIFHPFWHAVLRYKWVVLLTIIAASLTGLAIHRRRPYHRSEMMRGIINDLAVTDLGKAKTVAIKCIQLNPDNHELRSQLAHILLLRREYDEADRHLALVPESRRTPFETMLKAWVLVGKQRLHEAMALVETIGGPSKRMPGVAIVRAEFAASQGDTQGVADNVVYAANSILTLNRTRALFPFLASREQWQTIVKCHRHIPYANVTHALIAVIAHLRANSIYRGGQILKEATERWPDEPGFLDCLLNLAILKPGGSWEQLFVENLRSNLSILSNDQLATYLNSCMRIRRPDIAWLTWHRLHARDPRDPSLFLVPARFSDQWLSFRRRQLDLPGTTEDATVDLIPLYNQTRDLWPLSALWSNIPLARDFATNTPADLKKKYLAVCLDELDHRERADKINRRMRLMRPTALASAGRFNDAHAELDRLEVMYPLLKSEFLRTRMVLYDVEGKWQEAYESARQYIVNTGSSNLDASLVRINALIHLDYGMYALTLANRAVATFPDVPRALVARAAVLDAFRLSEEALFALEELPHRTDLLPTIASLLYSTGRYTEFKRISEVMGTSPDLWPATKKQYLLLRPAELATTPSPRPAFNRRQHDAKASEHKKRARNSASPFMRDLHRNIANWHKEHGTGDTSQPEQWESIGRDTLERAAALNELALLLTRNRQHDKADHIAKRALELVPDSPALWRLRIAISSGKPEIVEQARRACPSDPEVWLASLIVRHKDMGVGPWARKEIAEAAAGNIFPPGTFVRAGDFLWRRRMPEAADMAARHAMPRCRGLLPAFVLGLRCSIALNDLESALSRAMHGAEHAIDLMPFYKTIVSCKVLLNKVDRDLLTTLEQLHDAFPEEARWPEQLATFYFQRGDTRNVLSVLTPVLEKSQLQLQVHTLLLGAEAARIEGKPTSALVMLEKAFKIRPQEPAVLNNLVYGLASEPDTLDRARKLLPQLLASTGKSASVLDTAALVYMASDDYEKANTYISKALAVVKRGDYAWAEIHLHAAQVQYHLGDHQRALAYLDLVNSDSKRSPLCDVRARELRALIEQQGPDKP